MPWWSTFLPGGLATLICAAGHQQKRQVHKQDKESVLDIVFEGCCRVRERERDGGSKRKRELLFALLPKCQWPRRYWQPTSTARVSLLENRGSCSGSDPLLFNVAVFTS